MSANLPVPRASPAVHGSRTKSTRRGFIPATSVKTLPAAREAIEQKKWKEADAALVDIGKILDSESALILNATEELEKATQ